MIVTVAVIILSLLSYYFGISAVLKGQYKPNVYSRIIWLLLSVNSLIGVIAIGNEMSTIALSILQTIGSLLILLGSLKYSIMRFGKIELISTTLLILSGVLWLFGVPVINVGISLVAHFIGGIPTISAVTKKPSSENLMFWLCFCLASALAFIVADKSLFRDYMFALYFMLFNLLMVILSARQYFDKKPWLILP